MASLISLIAAAHPDPLFGSDVKFPQIVEDRTSGRRPGISCANRIQSEPAEEPDVAGCIRPHHSGLTSSGGRGSTSGALRTVIPILVDDV